MRQTVGTFVMLRVGMKYYELSSHTFRSSFSSNRIASWSSVDQEWGYM